MPTSKLNVREPVVQSEIIVCGWHAAMARFRFHPESIIRAYVSEERVDATRACLRYLAAQRKTYHIVDHAVLQKVSGTVHHGGLVFLVKQAPALGADAFLKAVSQKSKHRPERASTLLVLDGIDNAQNMGAIVRVAAHFGVNGLLFGARDGGPRLDSAAFYRTAAGGAEADLLLGRCTSRETTRLLCELKKQGWELYGATSRGAHDVAGRRIEDLHQTTFPQKVVLVIGSETHGLSESVEACLPSLITIPGTGAVESLNAACATSIILAERARQLSVVSHKSSVSKSPR